MISNIFSYVQNTYRIILFFFSIYRSSIINDHTFRRTFIISTKSRRHVLTTNITRSGRRSRSLNFFFLLKIHILFIIDCKQNYFVRTTSRHMRTLAESANKTRLNKYHIINSTPVSLAFSSFIDCSSFSI